MTPPLEMSEEALLIGKPNIGTKTVKSASIIIESSSNGTFLGSVVYFFSLHQCALWLNKLTSIVLYYFTSVRDFKKTKRKKRIKFRESRLCFHKRS